MSDPILAAIIVAAQAIAVAWINRQVKTIEVHAKETKQAVAETKAAVAETKAAIVILEKNTNSIKDELVRVTGKEQRAAGKLEGRAEQKAEGNVEEGSG